MSTREKLSQMAEIVKENLTKAQLHQKTWYDKRARLREFKRGDLVLVLLPTTSNKLLAQWQRPYQVVQRMGKVTYLIDMQDKKKRKRIFHVNMLKDYHVREADGDQGSYFSEEYQKDEFEIPSWRGDSCSRKGQEKNSPYFKKGFIVQTDASDRGVGAVLTQVGVDGQEHPVGYFSQKPLPREQRYSTIEKECLAIKLSLDAFKVYLLGRNFVVQTDHRALEWMERLKENNARLCRWSLSLQPYSFVVQHRPGAQNLNADALSRNPAMALLQEKGEKV